MDPPYLQALKGEMPIMKMGWFKSYKANFIDANRFRPVVHIITGIMCLGYTLEYFHHLRREPPPAPLPLAVRDPRTCRSSRSHLCSLPAADMRHKNVRKAALSDDKHH